MKKFTSLLVALVLMVSGFTYGQGTTTKAKPAIQAQTKTNTKQKAAATQPSGAKLKQDGTPDRRYKENKKLKKDGTPDMRYKENKAAK